ncbi:MAG TPA: class II aldolase/adducin family protein [Gemmatimonadales bacterium]|nr:class II aldolase/adducin family protein [Gemmatimonadales bacterium]
MNARDAARQMARCCRQLAERGLIAGQDGNLSVRLSATRALVTPSGLIKAQVTPGDMVEVDLAGRRRRGRRKPTSELDLHLRILRHRPDVGAVVHAHPPVATGFAVAGAGLDRFVLPELVVLVGPVPLVPYGTPGTPELGDRVEPYLGEHDAFLLANHGAVTMGSTIEAAWIRMESLEHAARILLVARMLGKVSELGSEAIARLEAQRKAWGRRESNG